MRTFPILYQKTATGSINYWQVWADAGYVFTRWGQVGTTSPQEQVYAAEPKNVGRANERNAEAQAEFEAEALWKKKLRLKYYESQEEASSEVNFKPLLAQEYNKRKDKIKFPVSVQPKLDGYRCMAYERDGQVHLMSRGGKEFTMGHISGTLRGQLGDLILDGELYVHGMSLQNIGSLIKLPRPESVAVGYHVYDCTRGGEERWDTREYWLSDFCTRLFSPYIFMVQTFEVGDHETINQFHDAFVSDGYEGAIIRTMDHPYRFGYRSPGLLKLKNFEDKEFPVIDWTTDKDGTIMFVVRLEDKQVTAVRPMGTDNQRAAMLMKADTFIGQQLTVRFQGRTDKNIPKFARGLIREEWDL